MTGYVWRNKESFSDLWRAVKDSDVELTRMLLSNCPDVNACSFFSNNDEDKTLLHVACENNNIDIVASLIASGADVNLDDCDGYTPLHIAHSPEIVSILLDHGANFHARESLGATPMHIAAVDRDAWKIKLLAARGADVNDRLPTGEHAGATPLHVAATFDKDVTETLLELGADPNAKITASLWTPLHCAVQAAAHPDLLRTLLSAGALPDLVDSSGDTPLCYAMDRDSKRILADALARPDALTSQIGPIQPQQSQETFPIPSDDHFW